MPTLFDLPDPLLSQIVLHSKAAAKDDLKKPPAIFCTSTQARDAVLRTAKKVRLYLPSEQGKGAAIAPSARLLGRASSLSGCQDLGLFATHERNTRLDISQVLAFCSTWPSVQHLELEVSLGLVAAAADHTHLY
jgi:hypothetical protein